MRRIRSACCARAASGHAAAAPPRSVMNSRRFIAAPVRLTRLQAQRLAPCEPQCPLWVKSGHVRCTSPCPLCAKSGHCAPNQIFAVTAESTL